MPNVFVERMVKAPTEKVFEAVADINKFSEIVIDITNVEFLTEKQVGVGARFRETRMMSGKEAATELEVTEYIENERVRMVSDQGGTIWDTVFEVEAHNDGTRLTMNMDARPYKIFSKIINRFIMGMVSRAVENDMDSVKQYCEKENIDGEMSRK